MPTIWKGSLPNNFYWYGGKCSKPGRSPALRGLLQKGGTLPSDKVNHGEQGSQQASISTKTTGEASS